MGRIAKEKQDTERIIERLDTVEARLNKQDQEKREKMEQEYAQPYDDVDRAIIRFIDGYQKSKGTDKGPNQTEIIDFVKMKYDRNVRTSRPKIIDRLENLVSLGDLVVRQEKKYNVSRYYHNRDNLLGQVDRYFDQFEIALTNLIKAFFDKNGPVHEPPSEEELYLFGSVFVLFQHVRALTLTHATFNWPRTVKDPLLLSRLYVSLVSKLRKLETSLALLFDKHNVGSYNNFVLSSWQLSPEVIDELIFASEKVQVSEEAFKSLDIAWAIGAKLIKYVKPKFEPDEKPFELDETWNPRTWRDAYTYWKGKTAPKNEPSNLS
jgi:hypothetical protein